MKNVSKQLRKAYVTALAGLTYDLVAVPVADGFSNAEAIRTNHIIIGEITKSLSDKNQSGFINDVFVSIDIVTRQLNGFTHDIADDIEDQILQIVCPTVITNGLGAIAGFQVVEVEFESSRPLEEEGENGNIIRNIVRLKNKIVQI